MTDPILTLTTPAVLFSAISLILLAYTNRFLGYAGVVRNLYAQFQEKPQTVLKTQIELLRRRIKYIRVMQLFGTLSLFLCVGTMFLIYIGMNDFAAWTFGVAMLSLILSLGLSIYEIQISTRTIELHLNAMEHEDKKNSPPKNNSPKQ